MEVDQESKTTETMQSDSTQNINQTILNTEQPICVITLGMAGSGKSSLISKLITYLYGKNMPPYVVNCDPACLNTDYLCNVDIRDTIHYKNVMQKYGLGPNGSIITSLNLFVTNFDQVIGLIDKRKEQHKYVLFDTPGQVEVFTWSASGSIITEALASKYPTVILFVIDTVRSHNPTTFMSNMLYACSIVYKYKLPMIVALNKNDVIDTKFAIEWMQNSEIFEAAINKDPTYMACLNQALTSALDIFYQDLPVVSISAKTGQGFDNLIASIHTAAKDYEENYRPEIERRKQEEQVRQLNRETNDLKLNEDNAEDNVPERNDSLAKPNNDEDLITFGPKKSFEF
ncbi:hypothetical protein RDWZM_001387 [Blomia tropicalis]|uniref:GPN-loop GTPase n=1 Tax=Blomia tropicalis TaxID=40697 RepID=A0A9Q0MEH5_BLOTA|nr:hypothetical protein RDWZM_001387 [Blomia tropicalis]